MSPQEAIVSKLDKGQAGYAEEAKGQHDENMNDSVAI